MLANFNQKLAQDRRFHTQELEALYSATPGNSTCKSVLSKMIQSRHANNKSRTVHDANMWAETDHSVSAALGGGMEAREVLAHGVHGTSPASRMSGGGRVSDSLPLHNPEAAELWGELLNGGGMY